MDSKELERFNNSPSKRGSSPLREGNIKRFVDIRKKGIEFDQKIPSKII
jgi:hypothetical protein